MTSRRARGPGGLVAQLERGAAEAHGMSSERLDRLAVLAQEYVDRGEMRRRIWWPSSWPS